jgi:hypothetical protein
MGQLFTLDYAHYGLDRDRPALFLAGSLISLSVSGDDLRFVPGREFTSPLRANWLWFWIEAGLAQSEIRIPPAAGALEMTKTAFIVTQLPCCEQVALPAIHKNRLKE